MKWIGRPGAGRKSLSENDTSLIHDLRKLLELTTRCDPQSPLLWTCKSLSALAKGLRGMGRQIGGTLVGDLLHKLEYCLQSNRKTLAGSNHPDSDALFHPINERVNVVLSADESAISVDAEKKELVGDFKIVGREWRPSPHISRN